MVANSSEKSIINETFYNICQYSLANILIVINTTPPFPIETHSKEIYSPFTIADNPGVSIGKELSHPSYFSQLRSRNIILWHKIFR